MNVRDRATQAELVDLHDLPRAHKSCHRGGSAVEITTAPLCAHILKDEAAEMQGGQSGNIDEEAEEHQSIGKSAC